MEPKIFSFIVENKITTPILIKLFAINMVANNFLGLSNKSEIILPLCESFVSKSSRFFWSNENKATSEPEIKAEHTNNKATPTSPKTKLKSIVLIKLEGSGSKLICIS